MPLPDALGRALAEVSAELPPGELAALSARISARYRSGAAPRLRTASEAATYASVRMPATYAATAAALAQARERLPGWAPRSLLDAGAGPGTATWAAAAVWPSLERATLVEREPAMIALGRRLGAPLASAAWIRTDLAGPWAAEAHDLVVAAYVAGETPGLVAKLWTAARGLVVIVEPGTPAGFARVRTAREQLLAAGARVAAPCPHDGSCPLAGPDWCHFAARVQRSGPHRRAKGGALGYEDEKFAFVAAARGEPAPSAGRVLRHPQVRKGHVLLAACTPAGLRRLTVARSEAERYRLVRDLRWGSELPADDRL